MAPTHLPTTLPQPHNVDLVLRQCGPSPLLDRACRDLARAHTRDQVRGLLSRAAWLYRNQSYESAAAAFATALRLDGSEELAWEGAGFCAFQLGDYRRARACLRRLSDRFTRQVFRTSLEQEMVFIPSCRFRMGATARELELAYRAEVTNMAHDLAGDRQQTGRGEADLRRQVERAHPELRALVSRRYTRRLTQLSSFSSGNTLVNRAQFAAFDPGHDTPSGPDESNSPAIVSWEQATAFCRWLSQREQRLYRLPTEAEWELVARAQNNPDCQHFRPQGGPWFPDLRRTVFQWCLDTYSDTYPAHAEPRDPFGPHQQGPRHVIRGGTAACRKDNVCTYPWGRRASARCLHQLHGERPLCRHVTGFRIVCEYERLPRFLEQAMPASALTRSAPDAHCGTQAAPDTCTCPPAALPE